VGGLGESERADRVQAANGRQPALLLHVASEQVDRLHRELGLDAEKRAQAAVAAMQLHDDQAARERAHAGAAVAGDASPYRPFFVAQLQAGNVKSISSLEDSVDGQLKRPVRYDPPG
jgi:hypothetical protein